MRKGREIQSLSWVAAGFSLRLKTLKTKQIAQTEVCGYEENYLTGHSEFLETFSGGEV
jgi:hypothetical protein